MLKINAKRRRTAKQVKKERAEKAKEQVKIQESVERGRRMEQELAEAKQTHESDAAAIELLIE